MDQVPRSLTVALICLIRHFVKGGGVTAV